jgi:hypothetical protein
MKIKNSVTVLLIAIILTSCVPLSTPIPMAIITLTSTAPSTPSPTKTSTPDPRILINSDSETYFVTERLLYSENTKTLNIDPIKVRITQSPSIETLVGDILWYMDDATGTRFIWNNHLLAWVPEFTTSKNYKNPEESPVVPLEAYYDGSNIGDSKYTPSSVALSDALYIAEHPELIAPDASYPYYRVTLFGNDKAMIGYQIGLTGPNQYLLINENRTKLLNTQPLPFSIYGIQQTRDEEGYIIYIAKKANWNPTNVNPYEILVTNMGFDKSAYDEWFQYPLILRYFANDPKVTGGELVPLFPSPDGQFQETNPNLFYYEKQPANPHVASLLSAHAIEIFEPYVRKDILRLYPQINKPFDADTNPGSYLIGYLPPQLSNMIHYTGVQQFYV